MEKIAVILGSARSDGNTRKVVNQFLENFDNPTSIFDLNDYSLEYFDYNNDYTNDHYFNLCKDLIEYNYWVFATPVYWYSMSAIMKNFLDRITDLISFHTDLGDQLKKVHLGVLSCSGSPDIPDFFPEPFKLSAAYLDMGYLGHAHAWTSRLGEVKNDADQNLKKFSHSIINLKTSQV